MEKYGLERYIATGEGVKPGEAEKRMELLDKAWGDYEREHKNRGTLGDVYDWLRKPAS